MNNDLLSQLESFVGGHKARSVSIEIDNGYGATCWTVTLGNEKRTIRALELSERGTPHFYIKDTPCWEDKEDNCINVYTMKDWREDWSGLHKTVELALKVAKDLLDD